MVSEKRPSCGQTTSAGQSLPENNSSDWTVFHLFPSRKLELTLTGKTTVHTFYIKRSYTPQADEERRGKIVLETINRDSEIPRQPSQRFPVLPLEGLHSPN